MHDVLHRDGKCFQNNTGKPSGKLAYKICAKNAKKIAKMSKNTKIAKKIKTFKTNT